MPTWPFRTRTPSSSQGGGSRCRRRSAGRALRAAPASAFREGSTPGQPARLRRPGRLDRRPSKLEYVAAWRKEYPEYLPSVAQILKRAGALERDRRAWIVQSVARLPVFQGRNWKRAIARIPALVRLDPGAWGGTSVFELLLCHGSAGARALFEAYRHDRLERAETFQEATLAARGRAHRRQHGRLLAARDLVGPAGRAAALRRGIPGLPARAQGRDRRRRGCAESLRLPRRAASLRHPRRGGATISPRAPGRSSSGVPIYPSDPTVPSLWKPAPAKTDRRPPAPRAGIAREPRPRTLEQLERARRALERRDDVGALRAAARFGQDLAGEREAFVARPRSGLFEQRAAPAPARRCRAPRDGSAARACGSSAARRRRAPGSEAFRRSGRGSGPSIPSRRRPASSRSRRRARLSGWKRSTSRSRSGSFGIDGDADQEVGRVSDGISGEVASVVQVADHLDQPDAVGLIDVGRAGPVAALRRVARDDEHVLDPERPGPEQVAGEAHQARVARRDVRESSRRLPARTGGPSRGSPGAGAPSGSS